VRLITDASDEQLETVRSFDRIILLCELVVEICRVVSLASSCQVAQQDSAVFILRRQAREVARRPAKFRSDTRLRLASKKDRWHRNQLLDSLRRSNKGRRELGPEAMRR